MAANRRIHEARTLLHERFGYDTFRAGQEEIVASVLQGKDVLGVLPTGGGKSVCFQIPALMFPACTLVVSPLVALMTDQVQRLTAVGIPAACLHSGITYADANQILYQAHQGKLKLLYVAPERLDSESFRTSLSTVSLSLLAVDEAHCVSEWGHDFRPAYRTIPRLFDHRQRVPIIAVTATATPDVRADITASLGLKQPTIIVRGFDRPNLSFSVVSTPHKVEYLTRLIKHEPQAPILVYAGSRRRVDTMVEELRKRKLPVVGYHAGKSPQERSAVQQAFINGTAPVMVATNAFGMGIDKSDIRHVVHTDLALTIEAYYQEAGRAGRDGKPATCTLLYVPEDKRLMDFFLECTYPEEKQIRAVLDYLHYRAGGAIMQQPLLVDAANIATDIHEPIARVQGILGVLARNGVILRTNPSGTTTIAPRTTHGRLVEFANNQSVAYRSAADAIVRLLQGSTFEMGVHINAHAFLRKHGLQPLEFHQVIRSMLVQRLISFREPEQSTALMVMAEYTPGGALPLDMEPVHARRNHAQQKLTSMLGYATTQQCKRNTILAYFGDTSAQGVCKRCSSCTTPPQTIVAPHGTDKEIIAAVRAVHELNGRFGKHVVADVLTGSVSEKVVQYRLDRATSWGAVRASSREFVLRVLDEAVGQNLLVRSNGSYPTLAVTNKGVNDAAPMPKRLDLTTSAIRSVDVGVYGALVMLRDQIAEQERVVPTAILSLAAIERMAIDMPETLASLKPGEHGSGLFLARHGNDVVAAIRAARQTSVRAIPKVRVDDETVSVVRSVAKHNSLDGVASSLQITKAKAAQLIQRAIEAGLRVEVERMVATETLVQVVEFVRQHRYAKLRHVRDTVGADIDLPELRVAMAYARRELYGVLP